MTVFIQGVAAAGALTRAGGNTTEATTTSLTEVDLLSATVSIAVGIPALIVFLHRKTAGAATQPLVGLKLNTTVVRDALGVYDNTDEAGSGIGYWRLYMGGATSYLYSPGVFHSRARATGGQKGDIQTGMTADMITVTVTSVVIRGYIGLTGITLGCDELHVYTYAVS